MQKRRVKKASGSIRVLFCLSRKERRKYRKHLYWLNMRYTRYVSPYAHGFVRGRNIVTNALQHVERKMTVTADISDFFDSITLAMLPEEMRNLDWISECFLDEKGEPGRSEDCRARQGLPTSPFIANIVASPMDYEIVRRLAEEEVPGFVYTRYADDLAVSTVDDAQETAERIKRILDEVVRRYGFSLNRAKTRVQRAKGGRREICGVMVDDGGVYASRRFRRRLRAASHQEPESRRTQGMREFALLKLPREYEEENDMILSRLGM